ncbi:MAG: alpha-D-ribose 1-methylphosphonate 5-triphosphate diphosphatase [Pseudomonadota bacterium]
MPVSLTGGRVLVPDGTLSPADLHFANGLITEEAASNAVQIDCTGYHVMPGIVDIHGDAFEMALFPRPGVGMPFDIAMGSVDRQLVASGITTAFHGLSVSWEPGARSLDAGRRFMQGMGERRGGFLADHRVQIRWETYAHEAIEDVKGWLALDLAPSLAFNNHTPATIKKINGGDPLALDRFAMRAGLSTDGYLAEFEQMMRCADDVPGRIRELAARAAQLGTPMLAHDEPTPAVRAEHRALGMKISEFPMARDVAADATAHGEHVVMGGPNVIRGGSHIGWMSAEEAVREGVCDIIASDYYYPSLLSAAERFVNRGVMPLERAWQLISGNPSAAMGLSDRGALAPGRRADIAIVDCTGPWRVVHTIAAGRLVSFGR